MNCSSLFVSVIVPNYNHARYLKQRIQSILNQTYQNFELIILDDNSPDDGASRKIIEQYRDDPHVAHVVYNSVNSGSPFKQWEKGINIAKGEYVWIAESDDYCDQSFLQELVRQITIHPTISLAYCLSQPVNSEGLKIGRKIKKRKNKFLNGGDFVRKYMCCENPVYNASSAIFKRSAAIGISKQYMKYKGTGDRMFWIEIAERGDVAVVNIPLNYFRQHNEKVTPKRSFDGTNLKEAKQTFDYLSKRHLSVIRRFFVKGFYLYLISSTNFESKDIKKNLFFLWGRQKLIFPIQALLGRAFVSLRYKLNLYL